MHLAVLLLMWLAAIPEDMFVDAFPEDICDKFKKGSNSIFDLGCRKALDPLVADYVHEDCKYFQYTNDHRLERFLVNINLICHRKNNPVCRDIVFMMDASNEVTGSSFTELKEFVKKIVAKLFLDESEVSHFVHALSFSNEVSSTVSLHNGQTDVTTAIDNFMFVGTVRATYEAIDELKELFSMEARERCKQVGVLLQTGKSNDKVLTLNSIRLFNMHKNVFEMHNSSYSLIAIGIGDTPDQDFENVMQAVGSGAGMENVIMVNDFDELCQNPYVIKLFDMLASARRTGDGECSQYVPDILDRPDRMPPYYGVYEIDGDQTCVIPAVSDVPVYVKLDDGSTLSKVSFRPIGYAWAIYSAGVCSPNFGNALLWQLHPDTGQTQESATISPLLKFVDGRYTATFSCFYKE